MYTDAIYMISLIDVAGRSLPTDVLGPKLESFFNRLRLQSIVPTGYKNISGSAFIDGENRVVELEKLYESAESKRRFFRGIHNTETMDYFGAMGFLKRFGNIVFFQQPLRMPRQARRFQDRGVKPVVIYGNHNSFGVLDYTDSEGTIHTIYKKRSDETYKRCGRTSFI
jgi:hypothetical protein